MSQKIIIKVLVALNVDFNAELGGLERSSVNLVSFLSKQPSIECYCAFNVFVDKIENCVEIVTTINDETDLKKIIFEHKIDIVVLPGGPWYARLAAKAVKGTGCKIITAWHFGPGIRVENTIQDILSSYKNEKNGVNQLKLIVKMVFFPLHVYRMKFIEGKLFRDGYRLSNAFVVLASSYINSFRKIYSLPDTNKMEAINNSLSFDAPIPYEEISKKEKTILIVARFDESSKRLTYALKIWKLLEDKNPEWKLQFVGDGKDRSLYEELVKKLQLQRVVFEGRQNSKEYYIKASIFFMTSSHEGWPMTLLEAQQLGCVPIAMNSFGSLHDIIQDGLNGFIVENGNFVVFAARTQHLIDNHELRATMAWNAVLSCANFAQDKIGHKWLTLLQNMH